MNYFKDDEFKCKCGHCPPKPPDAVLLGRLNRLRERYGKPIWISSGWRCDTYNALVGGVSDSAHLIGKAADIFCTGSADRYRLLTFALPIFQRIGVGTTFLHLDVDENKDQGVIWLYGNH